MTETRRRRARRALAVAAACAALPTAPALAAPDQLSLIEDEKLMLESGAAAQAQALDEAKALGADVIRANVIWSRYAPSPTSRKRPRGFDGKDPADYPPGAFDMLDSFVAGTQARGMQVLLTPTGPIPSWASRCGGSLAVRRVCKPDPQLFGAFVRLLGTRYPTVKLWSIWNEPNLRSWLRPQYEVSGSQAKQTSASLYRALASSAIAALRGTGHRDAQIWLGETAPLGDDPSGCSAQRRLRVPARCASKILKTSPEVFLRGVFCLNSSGRRLTGVEGRDQRCGSYKRLSVTGYAHHPYTRGGSRPPLSRTNRGEITIGVASRLTRLLDQAARAKRIPASLPIHYTEHGWQTNPPDRIFGVTDAQQAEYMNQSDWIAYNNARVRTVAQYKIVDDENIGAGFQMGVRLFSGGARKPAYSAYKLPIWVSGNSSQVTVYGQVRPADSGAALQVDVQAAASSSASFSTVADRAGDLGQRHVHGHAPAGGQRVAATVERDDVTAGGGSSEVRRTFSLVLVTAAALCAAAAPAHAADFEVGMEDEGLLLSNPHLAAAAVFAWKGMGVDVVRIHARWWEIAPDRNATRAPSGFNANNPNDPRYNWVALDTAIAEIRNAGMRPMVTITGPGPLWTSGDTRKRNPLWKPKPADYASFARAVATRYRAIVDRYLLWNEPNQKGWLQPQWQCDRRRRNCQPMSPHLYRSLVRAAEPVVHSADPGSEIVVGELAPVGDPPISDLTPMKPLEFMRGMGCVDTRYRSIRTGSCRGFKALKANSFGYHPHPQKLAPDKVNPDVDEAQFGDLPRLFKALDRLKAKKRLRLGSTFHLTEFGYETSPPDSASGISLALQTRYLQQAAYIAWKSKRVRGLSFYQWDDEPTKNLGSGTRRYFGWQTGLRFNNGRPKPVLSTMLAPFVIDQAKGSRSGVLWGQVRGDGLNAVTIQVKERGAADFRDLVTVNTRADGTWSRRITLASRAAYRYRWTPRPNALDPSPFPRVSGAVDLGKSEKSAIKASLATA